MMTFIETAVRFQIGQGKDGRSPVIAFVVVSGNTFGGKDEHSLRCSDGEKVEEGNEE